MRGPECGYADKRRVRENGWEAFAKWDFKKVHRSALIAAIQRAGSKDYDEVRRAGDRLLEKLPGEKDQ